MIPDWVKPGASYRYRRKVFHIRAVVDGDQVVIREWWKRKQYWHYSVEDACFFDIAEKSITVVKR